MSVLAQILERKRLEVEALERSPGLRTLRRRAEQAPEPRGFGDALCSGPSPRVIAEFKRASPSKGSIRAEADPGDVARAYARSGAAALSVLTDRHFFQGSLDDLRAARAVCEIPILRKDFVIHEIQILEARAAGADALLLIVAALEEDALRELIEVTHELGMDALVEVHTHRELERARAAGAEILGINNRDLHSFKTDPGVTRELLPFAGGFTIVSESGLDQASLLSELAAQGVDAFLIGEALMRESDPGLALRKLRGVR